MACGWSVFVDRRGVGLGVQLAVPPTSAIAAQLSGTFSLSDVGGTLAGTTFNGIANNDKSDISVSSTGDVNGDELDELLIGALFADGQPVPEPSAMLLLGAGCLMKGHFGWRRDGFSENG